jgi:hypothetical protein
MRQQKRLRGDGLKVSKQQPPRLVAGYDGQGHTTTETNARIHPSGQARSPVCSVRNFHFPEEQADLKVNFRPYEDASDGLTGQYCN